MSVRTLATALALASAPASFADDVASLLSSSCLPCHGPAKSKAGLDFSVLDDAALRAAPDLVGAILERLRDGSMPPADAVALELEDRDVLIAHFASIAAAHPAMVARSAGRTLPRRLTRSEFRNALRDLLRVEVSVDAIPRDPSGGAGFENDADTLFTSPLLLETWIDTASAAIARADLATLLPPGREAESLLAIARRAFRRPLPPADAARLVGRLDAGPATALLSIFASPRFVMRIEGDTRSDPRDAEFQHGASSTVDDFAVDDFELAERLSFFLWSSVPDDALFDLAARGALHEPTTLRGQVRRMLDDPRSRALADEFAAQWLDLRRLETTCEPDPGRFPTYTHALRAAMVREVTDVFDVIVRENRSVLELLDADWTIVGAPLAEHYGIAASANGDVQRVALPSRERGGVVASAAVLTLTSHPLRTSPVLRGKWILETILGTPPPPPPANAGVLPAEEVQKDGLSLRQRLEQHRARAECRSCHERIDPLGFALEAYDPIGRLRAALAEDRPVDAIGTLPDGTVVDGMAGLKDALLARRDVFATNLAGKLLAFALNRGLTAADDALVLDLASRLAWSDYSARTLIEDIAGSYPFRHRSPEPRAPVEANR
jgi:hypothetical protein